MSSASDAFVNVLSLIPIVKVRGIYAAWRVTRMERELPWVDAVMQKIGIAMGANMLLRCMAIELELAVSVFVLSACPENAAIWLLLSLAQEPRGRVGLAALFDHTGWTQLG
jgi:hypothetical protein